jgi:hypothetical protein
MGKDKVKTAEHSRDQARARNVALTAELVQRNDEASRATAELRIATRRRDEARAQANGQGGDIESVQRDFARLFKVIYDDEGALFCSAAMFIVINASSYLSFDDAKCTGSAANAHRSD